MAVLSEFDGFFIEDDGFLSINRGIRKNSIENENDVHRNNYSFAYMGDAI